MRLRLLTEMLAVALLIAGCDGDGSSCTTLPGGPRYCLQTTDSIAPFDAQQKVDVTFDGRRETMIAQLEADADGIRIAGMTPFGQKLLQVSFDNRDVSTETFPGKGLDPVLLLALVQVATWPAEQVRAGLDGADVIDEFMDNAPAQRRLVKDGKDIVVIRYTRGRPPAGDMRIELPAAGVEFSISNLDIAASR